MLWSYDTHIYTNRHSNQEFLGFSKPKQNDTTTMDQRQKELLNSVSAQLAEEMDFQVIAEQVQLAKLVSQDKMDDIVVSILIVIDARTNDRHLISI